MNLFSYINDLITKIILSKNPINYLIFIVDDHNILSFFEKYAYHQKGINFQFGLYIISGKLWVNYLDIFCKKTLFLSRQNSGYFLSKP